MSAEAAECPAIDRYWDEFQPHEEEAAKLAAEEVARVYDQIWCFHTPLLSGLGSIPGRIWDKVP